MLEARVFLVEVGFKVHRRMRIAARYPGGLA